VESSSTHIDISVRIASLLEDEPAESFRVFGSNGSTLYLVPVYNDKGLSAPLDCIKDFRLHDRFCEIV
jgi:hypothetical protein